MKTISRTGFKAIICTLVLFSTQGFAAEDSKEMLARGEKLVQESCTRCHGDEMYTRQDRRVNSLDALGKQVRRCRDNIGITWFDEDVNDVVYYLNNKYYKF